MDIDASASVMCQLLSLEGDPLGSALTRKTEEAKQGDLLLPCCTERAGATIAGARRKQCPSVAAVEVLRGHS
jgi:hypothetical protein